LDEDGEDEGSYGSDDCSEDNDMEEYMVHMDEQITELKEMIF
jgi:hypothetical protein